MIVTTGGRGAGVPSWVLVFSSRMLSSSKATLLTSKPNSWAINVAVSKSMVWLTVTIMPCEKSFWMTWPLLIAIW